MVDQAPNRSTFVPLLPLMRMLTSKNQYHCVPIWCVPCRAISLRYDDLLQSVQMHDIFIRKPSRTREALLVPLRTLSVSSSLTLAPQLPIAISSLNAHSSHGSMKRLSPSAPQQIIHSMICILLCCSLFNYWCCCLICCKCPALLVSYSSSVWSQICGTFLYVVRTKGLPSSRWLLLMVEAQEKRMKWKFSKVLKLTALR